MLPVSTIVSDLVASGLSEAEIGTYVGLSQASINRIKLGTQKRPAFDAVDKLRALHRSRCAKPAACDTPDLRAEVARLVALASRGEREFHLLHLPAEIRGEVESELVLELASRVREGLEPVAAVPAWLTARVLEMAGVRPEKRAANA